MMVNIEGWITAIRPHTLPASLCPVIVGAGLAIHFATFEPLAFLSALITAVLLQVAVNLANDYFDYEKDVDTDDRQGFTRACASGLLEPEAVKKAMFLTLILTLIPGLYLVFRGGLPLLVLGIASVIAALTYSGGPVPYGSVGLGDFMVFFFFGILATVGTFYVQFCEQIGLNFPLLPPPYSVPKSVLLTGVAIGCISTVILVINNLRDRPQDEKSNKITLAVIIGDAGSRIEVITLLFTAYLIPLFLLTKFSYFVLSPLFSIPIAIKIINQIYSFEERSELNKTLKDSTLLLTVYSALIAAGFVLS